MVKVENGPTCPYISEFDPLFRIFHELMPFKVREILLVSSSYDAYIMEEDGSLALKITHEYRGLNLSHPPRITRVETVEQALTLLEGKLFDLVVSMPHLGGVDCNTFGEKVKSMHPDLPVILLSHNVHDAVTPFADSSQCFIDNTYVWCGDSDLLLAIVKCVEDSKNVDFDIRKAGVRVVLLVEDSAAHRSQILPIVYEELVRQTQSVLDEGLNERHRLLKMRARPKVLTAETYEEAGRIFTKYRQNIFAVISDVRFPKGGVVTDDAGIHLMQLFRYEAPDLPILMLSTDQDNKEKVKAIPAVFAGKQVSTMGEDIQAFFLDYLGFGDFIFRMLDGTETARASSLKEFEQKLKTIPDESLLYHAQRNHFSNWVMARAEVALASRMHKHHFDKISDVNELREDLVFKVHALRRLRQRGVVAVFRPGSYDPEVMDFVKIGQGSMGGKARGIAFMGSQLQQGVQEDSVLAQVSVQIPQTCVITTDGFDDFVALNELQYVDGQTDEDVERIFLNAVVPEWLASDLRAYLKQIEYPLSVRSSSILEDAQFRPYAGLYNTYMLTNSAPDFEVRFGQLIEAVKLVYASTWFEGPRAFSRSIGQTGEDSMAVIIQQVTGNNYGGNFYPALSGVVQSFNFYPVPPMKSEDGIAYIALGFGKTVVEGEQSLRFSPVYPENLPQFSTTDDILKNSQHWFYSLDCSDTVLFSRTSSNLVRREVDDAVNEHPVSLLCSTYFPEEHRIRDADLPGRKIVTFAPVLKYGFFPLPKVMRELTALGRKGMGCEVEIEFSVDLHEDPAKSVFYFLQIRPIVTGSERRDVQITSDDYGRALLYSDRALGHGLFTSIYDIVYVKPEAFDTSLTRDIAAEIGKINRILHRENKKFLLIGFGRWGSADPWLGIPVQWSDISGVGAIVEIQGVGVDAEPSQGTHFFQNITSLGIPYLMIDEGLRPGESKENIRREVQWEWFNSHDAVQETELIRHIRFKHPFVLKVNGQESKAIGYLDHEE